MSPTAKNRLQLFVGYPAFFSFAFVLMLYITFPYGALADRLSLEAKRSANLDIKIGSLGPAFLGFTARKVAITPPKQEGQTAEPEPIVIDEVFVRPTVLPLGVAFKSSLFGGTVSGSFVPLRSRPQLLLTAKNVDLGKSGSKAAMGLDMAGTLGASVDVTYDPTDFSRSSGKVSLSGGALLINGGTVMQYDLPKVDLGQLDAEVKIDQGKATIEAFTLKGNDVEAEISGEVVLAQKLPFSSLNLKVKFKPQDDFLKRNSFIATGLNYAMARDSKGYYTANVDRFLGNPHFAPVR